MSERDGHVGDLIDAQALARLYRQSLASRMPMVGNISGLHKSPHRGSSVEFAEYRKYSPGDDPRRLDWRVYGRTDRFYVREFEADTNLRCYLLLDTSGSMAFGSPSKMEYARRLAAHLAYLLVQQGDAVGLHCLQEHVQVEVPPRRHPAHLAELFQVLRQAHAAGETGMVRALHEIAETVRARALVILVSDLFCDVDALAGALRHLRFQKHDLAVFHLMDREELTFDFDRPLRFVDMEEGGSLLAEPSVVRTTYLDQLNAYLRKLKEDCLPWNVDYRLVPTDRAMDQVLVDFFVDRDRLKGAGR